MREEVTVTSETRKRGALLSSASLLWCAIAVMATIALYARTLHNSLDGDFGSSASASCLLMARSFTQMGPIYTHFVPIQNNLPIGSNPDVYLHWPPLYPLALEGFFHTFGDTPIAGRLLGLLIVLAGAAIVALIARTLYSTRVALLSGFFYLTCRATFHGARPLVQQPLAILFGSAAVLFFLLAIKGAPQDAANSKQGTSGNLHKLYGLAGIVCISLAILSAWDPIFIPFGLLAGAIYGHNRFGIKLGIVYVATAILTFAVVQADYILSYPQLFKNQLSTIAFRMGLVRFDQSSSLSIHSIIYHSDYSGQLSVFDSLNSVSGFIYDFIGPFALLSVCILTLIWFRKAGLRERNPDSSFGFLLFSLGLPWIAWYLIMRNFVSIHSFALVLAVPFAAIASARVLDEIWVFLNEDTEHAPILWIMSTVFPFLIFFPLLTEVRFAHVPPEPVLFSDLSPLVEQETPQNSVILSPSNSLVPSYYSHRHFVRGIRSDAWLKQAVALAHADFSGSPVFLAVQDADRKDFTELLSNLKVYARKGDSELYEIDSK